MNEDVEEAAGYSKTLRPESALHSCVTMKNDQDMDDPGNMSSTSAQTNEGRHTHRPPSPVPSCVSMKSDQSMPEPLNFSSGPVPSGLKPPSPVPSCVSMKSDKSMGQPLNFSSESVPSGLNELSADLTQDQSRCGVCERVLRDPVITTCGHSFCRQCISSYWEKPGLPGDQACTQCVKTCRTQPPLQPLLDEHTDMVESSRHLQTEHTPDRRSKPADEVLRRVIEKNKASLKRRFENISEGIIKPGAETLLNKIYTELYITEGESEGVNKEHEVWQVESASRAQTTEDVAINCNDIFKPLPGQERNIRTVMTKGVAGIGKTVSVQKFILDWIDGVANQNADFIFPLPFRELNLVRDDQYSLHELLLAFHPELKELRNGEEYKDCQVVFIFDGLDESRLPLNFQQNMISDLKQPSSVDVLMTSLIQGSLLPSAHIWITSRPAAASQIPTQSIDQVTEVRGFNDPQKEEYFRKRICDERKANRIISHIKASRSLHIMCHIPVFCWIAAIVLQQMLDQNNSQEIPKTLTEMFIHFLLIQITRKNQKYQSGKQPKKEQLLESQEEIILKLSKLAFKNLEDGIVIFYEEDLEECGIDVSEASVYSGMCTEIFKEESVFHQSKVYCFVHLSIQEFLAALHIFVSYSNQMETMGKFFCLEDSLKLAVTNVLESRNGHLDLFLRFLMGICLERNQRLLQGLLNDTHNSSGSITIICQYIKDLNKEDLSPERCISLLQCLSEVNDHSMHEDIQEYLNSPKGLKQKLSPAHCSALAHMLLMSEEVLDEFDLRKYNTSEEGRRRLIPAVRCSRKARLSGCKLTEKSCEIVASALQSAYSPLRELDFSQNDLQTSLESLLSALQSPNCKLETLRLAGCNLTEKSCEIVASALQSANSPLRQLDLSQNDLQQSGDKLLSALQSPNCKLETLRLAGCKLLGRFLALTLQGANPHMRKIDISDCELQNSVEEQLHQPLNQDCKVRLICCRLKESSCAVVASVLQFCVPQLSDLDMSGCDLQTSEEKLLSCLGNPKCQLETLKLVGCGTSKAGDILAFALQSANCHLRELDLSKTTLGDCGGMLRSEALNPHSKIETLRLVACRLTEESCKALASAVKSLVSLTVLDLSYNDQKDSGVQLLSAGLSNPHCKLKKLRLAACKVTEESCKAVASALHSLVSLRELDLTNNDLKDSGVQLLSAGLSSPHCKLQTLRLSCCLITHKGFSFLACALKSNPSYLKQLDLSYNHPGASGVRELTDILNDPSCKLETFRYDHGGECRIKPGLRKYACELTLDPNTADIHLSLSERNSKVTNVSEDQPYPDHPERFDRSQVLCREGLSGRCYWEAEWSGDGAVMALAYKRIQRKGWHDFGYCDKSWSLDCSGNSYSAWHNNKSTDIPAPSSRSSKVGVYLDWPAGILSFYSVSSDTLIHLHTFHSTFTEPLYPGFRVLENSVSLCQIT